MHRLPDRRGVDHVDDIGGGNWNDIGVIGYFSPGARESMAALVSALLVLVAGLLLALAVLFGLRRAALAVMLVRPSCDRIFDWVKDALHQSTGPGASINLLVIGL